MSLNKFDFWAQTTLIGTAVIGFCIITILNETDFCYHPINDFFVVISCCSLAIIPIYQFVFGIIHYIESKSALYATYLISVFLYFVCLYLVPYFGIKLDILNVLAVVVPILLFVLSYSLAIKNYWHERKVEQIVNQEKTSTDELQEN